MCLLFVIKEDTNLTAAQVAGFWDKNRDGYGVMYAKDGLLHTEKQLGNKEQWVEFYMRLQAMNIPMAFHLRMRTHGDTDLVNCHPYPVYNFEDMPQASHAVAMMHNGVLRTGNDKDKTKSDTWHYVRDYVHKLTGGKQELIFTPEFAEVIGSHIGSGNKFCFVNSAGDIQIINRSSGTDWNGVWFSNTYAWTPHDRLLYPGAVPEYSYGGYKYTPPAPVKRSTPAVADQQTLDGFANAWAERERMFNDDKPKANKRAAYNKRRSAITPITTPLSANDRKDVKLVTSTDCDYVMECIACAKLEYPQHSVGLNSIRRSDVYRLLNKYGVDRVYKLVEEMMTGEILIGTFTYVFYSDKSADNYFKFLTDYTPEAKTEPTPSVNPLQVLGDDKDTVTLLDITDPDEDSFTITVDDAGTVIAATQGGA